MKLKNSSLAPLTAPAAWPGTRVYATSNILDTITTGTSNDTSEAYASDFNELLIGMRTSFTLEVSRQAADSTNSAFRNLRVWIRGYLRCDIAVERGSSFAVLQSRTSTSKTHARRWSSRRTTSRDRTSTT